MKECAQCDKESGGSAWKDGECCVGGGIFTCCKECGVIWADNNCIDGTEVEEAFTNYDKKYFGGEGFTDFLVVHVVGHRHEYEI